MKKSEVVLTAFTTAHSLLSSIPESETETVELTDEELEARPDRGISDTYKYACDLLEAIKSEEPHFQVIAEQNRKELWEQKEVEADLGLKTEINRSVSLVNVSDTMEGIAAVLKRHPFGYRNGSRDSKGRVVVEPYTAYENELAAQWLAGIKH